MKKLTLNLMWAALLAGCSAGSGDPAEITARSDAWEAALNAQDIDALVALYTDDARVMAPGSPIQAGTAAVRDYIGAMVAAGIGGELTTVEARVSGDLAYHVGTYTTQIDGTTVDTGKFVETWRRGDDGVWRISNDIWNSDAAAGHDGDNTHVVFLHEVEDADAWLAAWRGENSRHELFEANGAAHVHTFRSTDNANLTGLVVNVHDMGALQAMIESDEGQAAAAEDGVRMDTLQVLVEAE